MTDLYPVEITAARVATDNALEVGPGEFLAEAVAQLVRREENASEAVDADGVGQLDPVFLERGPDFSGRKLGPGGRMEQPAHRRAEPHELFPVGCVRKAGVEDKSVGFEFQAVAVHAGPAVVEHFDADAGQRTALGEFQGGEMSLEKLKLGRMTGPETQRERDGVVVLVSDAQNLAVLARPKLLAVHVDKRTRDA